jgi:hypothetical protein
MTSHFFARRTVFFLRLFLIPTNERDARARARTTERERLTRKHT